MKPEPFCDPLPSISMLQICEKVVFLLVINANYLDETEFINVFK